MNQLEVIASLYDNWDSHGASSFSSEIVEYARLVSKILPDFVILPTASGTIQFEKETEKGYLEFELFTDRRIKLFFTSDGKTESKFIEFNEIEKFKDYIK